MTRAITCINCGVEGRIEVPGARGNKSSHTFRHLGSNPVSGHLHYQCPDCEMVLLVEPMLIRANYPIFSQQPAQCRVSAGSPS